MKINWSALRLNIPHKVKSASKSFYEILWSDCMQDTQGKKIYGQTESNPKRILINVDQADKDAVLTYFHEFIHSLDFEHEIGLTEKQVIKLEKCLPYIKECINTLEGKK